MTGIFDGVAQSYLVGRAIGQGVRTSVNRRRVNKSVDKFEELDTVARAAEDAGDESAAKVARDEQAKLALKAFKAKDRLDSLNPGDTTFESAIKGRKTAPAKQAAPATPQEGSTAAKNYTTGYEPTGAALDFSDRLSSAAGRQTDVAGREELGKAAASQLWGSYGSTIMDKANAQVKENGSWGLETAQELGGLLQTVAQYLPQGRGAMVQVHDDGSLWLDLDGGGSGTATEIKNDGKSLEGISNYFSQAFSKPSTALGTDITEAATTAAGQKSRVLETNKLLLPKIIDAVTAGMKPIDAATIQAAIKSSTDAATALKGKGLTLAKGEGEGADGTWITTTPDGTQYMMSRKNIGTEGAPKWTTTALDPLGNEVNIASLAAKIGGNPQETVGQLQQLFALHEAASNDAQRALLPVLNSAVSAYINNEALELNPDIQNSPGLQSILGGSAAEGAIAPRGVGGGKRGRLDAETDNYITKITTNVTSPAYVAKHGKPPEGDARALAEWALPALVQQESGGDPNAVSPVGARGAFQIMPDTAANPGYGITPIADWNNASQAEQREFAIQYLTKGIEKGGSLAAGLAFYNGGERQMNNLLGGAASGERMAAVAQRPAPAPAAPAQRPVAQEPGINEMVPNSAYTVAQDAIGAVKRGVSSYNGLMFGKDKETNTAARQQPFLLPGERFAEMYAQ